MHPLLPETSNVKQENCFDFLRYFFAILVILSHFFTLIGQEQFWFMAGSFQVKAFFTITGFLVTYSFLRCDFQARPYFVKRIARIIPAYVVCIIFCILLGCLVTSLETSDFLLSKQTADYAVSNLFMLNWIEPELPGTFQNQTMPQMNGSLWSIKYEMLFYLILPLLIMIIKKAGKIPVLLPILILSLVCYRVLPIQIQYCTFFFTGMTLLLFFDTFYRKANLLLWIAIPLEVIGCFLDIPYISAICQTFEPITYGIIIIGIAYKCPALNFLQKIDNISYGMYLYHFPVIQFLIHCGLMSYSIKLSFILTIFLTIILACLSWFCIEKPMRKHIIKSSIKP